MEATGYDNIVLRGMYMNVPKLTMQRIAEEVGEFTELGSYLDMPVRTYSSGMMVRLAFGIATSMQPEILLMDEWLSAGDAPFLAKAHKRMEEFVGGSRIMMLASHSMELLQQWCNRGIFLHHGRVMALGDVAEVVDHYTTAVNAGSLDAVPLG
jgi:ABC-2 type transport system ATP-binding protein/lipopolysaccharide transport system ATP-binding protein